MNYFLCASDIFLEQFNWIDYVLGNSPPQCMENKQRNAKQIKLYSNKSSTTKYKCAKQLNGCFVLCLEICECHSCRPCHLLAVAHVVSASPGCCCMHGLHGLHLCHMERRRKVLYRNRLHVGAYNDRQNSIWSTRSVPYVLFDYLFFFTNKTFPIFNIPKIYTVMQAKQIPERERIRSVKGSLNKTSQNWLRVSCRFLKGMFLLHEYAYID